MIQVNEITKITDIIDNLKKIRNGIINIAQQNAVEVNRLQNTDPHLAICVTTYFNTLAIVDAALATSADAIEKGFVKPKQH
jgi:hypothetical protein